jgi:uncharacterized membrane protein (UPF0127 family)
MPLLRSCVAIAAICVALAGCSSEDAADEPSPTPTATSAQPPVVELRHGANVFLVEVADTPESRALGLGGRDAMAADAGMLFDLGETRTPTFSMRGMRFPLDIIWIDDAMRVYGIEADVPHQPDVPVAELASYSPAVPVRYVLELNAGTAAAAGIEPGDELQFELPR